MPRHVLRSFWLASLLVASPALAQGPATDAEPEAATDASATTDAAPREATVQLVPAFLMTYGGGASDNFGAGLQLRLDVHPTDRFPLRTGGYATGELLADGSFRVAGGLSGGVWLVGCRIGVAYRTEAAGFASTLGLEIGKSIDFMGFSIGGRVTVPLLDFVSPNGGPTRVQGVEGQVFLTAGWPAPLDGAPRRGCGCPHGRHAPSEAPAPIEEGATEDAPALDAPSAT